MSASFSHSRLSALDDCPRRYRFRYVDALPEAFQSAEAFMGTMVHEALQWLYLQREARAEPSEDELIERYRETCRQKQGPGVRVVQESGRVETFLEDGEGMLRRHLRGAFREDRLETIAVEPKISLKLGLAAGADESGGSPPQTAPDTAPAYIGYIDRLARDSQGTLHVIDYKTSKRMPASFDEAGLQVRGYGLGILEKHGGVEVGLRYEYLRHERSLSETMPLSAGPRIAAELSRRVERALQAERAGDFPARPSALCRWCGYRETCDVSSFFRASAAPVQALAPKAAPPRLGESVPGTCPTCGSGLRRRSSSRSELVTCVNYPDCGHARDGSAD